MVLLSTLIGAFDHAQQTPRLAARQGTARSDRHGVAFLALVVLVMRQQLRGAANVLAVRRMLDQALDLDRDGLVHLIAGHAAGKLAPDLDLVSRGIGGVGVYFLAHYFF